MTSLQQEVKKLREYMEASQITAGTLALTEAAVTKLTTTASKDLAIEAATGKDITVEMGDASAANKVSFIDSAEDEVAKVDSNGTITAVAFAGALTGNVTGNVVGNSAGVHTGNVGATAASNLAISSVAGKDVVVKMGDASAANKVSFIDSLDAEQVSIDSNGVLTAVSLVGPLTGDSAGTHTGDIAATSKSALNIVNAAADKNIVFKLGDDAAATKISFTDSGDSEQGYVDSNGVFYAKTSLAPLDYAHTDTSGAPTNTECVSAFGAAATVGSGFVGVYQDDGAEGVSYLCISNGTNYDVIAATAAA
jgi:hypothetical protein